MKLEANRQAPLKAHRQKFETSVVHQRKESRGAAVKQESRGAAVKQERTATAMQKSEKPGKQALNGKGPIGFLPRKKKKSRKASSTTSQSPPSGSPLLWLPLPSRRLQFSHACNGGGGCILLYLEAMPVAPYPFKEIKQRMAQACTRVRGNKGYHRQLPVG